MKTGILLNTLGGAIILTILLGSTTVALSQEKLDFFGYFSSEIEKSWNHPLLLPYGGIERETSPTAISVHSANLIFQALLSDRLKFYGNVAMLSEESDGKLEAVNLWGQYSESQYLNVRFGKMYRKFGLYNEILDAVPTYMGIDPPEHFSEEHQILSRTTEFMIFGSVNTGSCIANYALSADNSDGIGDSFEKSLPIGWDLNCKFDDGNYTIGTSGFHSFGDMHSDVDFGGGFPKNGVFPWMEKDQFSVFSGYAEAKLGDFTLQAEYVTSPHKAVRDVNKALIIVNEAELNRAQLARFLIDPNGAIDQSNINTKANYTNSSYYIRASYTFYSSLGEFTPFGWIDYLNNPENINEEAFGGDGETGDTDTGIIGSYTIGLVFRPDPSLAIKLENENHYAKFEKYGKLYSSDIRFNVSFIFGQ